MPPLISICVPAYNNAQFIGAALSSIVTQTYAHLEIIVVDDRSSDRTRSVVKGIADSRLRLVENSVNLGIGHNWNQALSFASGKYVKLMGADDLLYPECIQRQVEALEHPAHADVVLAICNTDVIDSSGKAILRRRFRLREGIAQSKDIIRKCVRWGANLLGEPVAGLFRREALAHAGLYDATNPYLLDLMFWASLLKHGNAVLDPTRLAAFRISAGSATTSLARHHVAYTRTFIRNMQMDPLYHSNALDAACGYFLALPRSILRNLIIRTHTRGGS